ncbi:MAG: hypothetical protein ACRETH_13305, partial [Steroidobacteraceae bacterium]
MAYAAPEIFLAISTRLLLPAAVPEHGAAREIEAADQDALGIVESAGRGNAKTARHDPIGARHCAGRTEALLSQRIDRATLLAPGAEHARASLDDHG